ncbi:hypothetical protein [Arthrobacter sp. NyZ413]|uniref:hypothetical protein n=1 Tax=Arthrobacter sp. NyZ413 TaxID=3144669 RepID=UPI003BF913F2
MTRPASSFINGRWVEGTGDAVSRFNPSAPEEAVTTYHQAGSAELSQAIQAAAEAAPGWGFWPVAGSCQLLPRSSGNALKSWRR